MDKNSVEAVLERLKLVFDAENDSDLCRSMGVNRQTMSSWRSRNSVPYAICVTIAEERNLSLDWLLTGKQVSAIAERPASYLSQREQNLLELFNELDERAQREIQCAAEEKKRVTDMERQLRELAIRVDKNQSKKS